MPETLVLGVGLEASFAGLQDPAWRSAGYFFTPAASIREAIDHLRTGDFDLVLLGHSIPADSRERLAFLIRTLGSHIPVVSIAESSGDLDAFADATIGGEASELLQGVAELLARNESGHEATPASKGNTKPEAVADCRG